MSRKIYIRDGRAPVPKKEITSRVMSAIKGKNTLPEKMLKKALLKKGVRGFKSHLKSLIGIPDIVYPKEKYAIFVNGCFWHRCPRCKYRLPKSHTAFWRRKFRNNIARDRRNIKLLKKMGWATKTVWECEIKGNLNKIVQHIVNSLRKRQKK